MNFKKFSYRFAEQVLNSNLSIKNEIENLISSLNPLGSELSGPNLNKIFREKLIELNWQVQPSVFEDPKDPSAKLDFLKDRLGIEYKGRYKGTVLFIDKRGIN